MRWQPPFAGFAGARYTFNNDVFTDLNDKLGETGILVNCPEGGGRRKGPYLPQRQLKTVKIFVLFNFIYSF